MKNGTIIVMNFLIPGAFVHHHHQNCIICYLLSLWKCYGSPSSLFTIIIRIISDMFQLSVLRMFVDNRLQRLRLYFFGPTVVHLELEVYHLCCMLLLSIGSLKGLYKETFGSYTADYYFIFVIVAALSRHLLFRIWCTWDPSTHGTPSLSGLISHFLQSYVTAGQSFDRPAPLIQLSIIHNFSSGADRPFNGGSSAASSVASTAPSISPSPVDRMVHITGGYIETRDEITWSQLLPSVLVYLIQIPRQYVWFPLTRLLATSHIHSVHHVGDYIVTRRKKKVHDPDPFTLGWFLGKYRIVLQYTLQLLLVYGPSLQFILSSKVGCDVLVLFLSMRTGKTSWLDFHGDYIQREATLLSINSHDANYVRQRAEQESALMVGNYDRLLKPSLFDVFWLMIACGTLCSCLFFSRIVLPIPDLVSCGNVSKDIRIRVPTSAPSGKKVNRAANVGSSSTFITRTKAWFSRFMASAPSLTSDSATWAERQNSIATSNRLRVNFFVVLCRVLENIVIVGVLPRTRFACRAMGHCPAGPSLWELSRILFPGGPRTGSVQASGYMESDLFSAIWAMLGVVIISITILVSQGVVLNRSHLSIAAYRALEWELVSKAPSQQRSATVWEVKRKYSKGEMVVYPDHLGALYRARVNSPEGHPSYNGFWLLGEELLSELGSPATSRLVTSLATFQYAAAILYFGFWFLLNLLGYHATSQGLSWAVISNMVAVHGITLSVSRSAARKESVAMRSFQKLNAEILKRNS